MAPMSGESQIAEVVTDSRPIRECSGDISGDYFTRKGLKARDQSPHGRTCPRLLTSLGHMGQTYMVRRYFNVHKFITTVCRNLLFVHVLSGRKETHGST